MTTDDPQWSPVPGYDVAGVEIPQIDEGLEAPGGWWAEPLPEHLQPASISINIEEMQDTFARIRESMDRFVAAYRNFYNPELDPDPRMGEWVPVHSLQPGTKVFILEGVFTVSAVDMDAPIPTVWLTELPDSPLYFDFGDMIPLAQESKD